MGLIMPYEMKKNVIIQQDEVGKGKPWTGNNGRVLNTTQSVEVMYLLVAAPDQEDDENGEQERPQSHDEEWKVRHQVGDEQQLLNSGCGCVVYGYTLWWEIERKKIDNIWLRYETLRFFSFMSFNLKPQMLTNTAQMEKFMALKWVSYLVNEHDGKDCRIYLIRRPVIDTTDVRFKYSVIRMMLKLREGQGCKLVLT